MLARDVGLKPEHRRAALLQLVPGSPAQRLDRRLVLALQHPRLDDKIHLVQLPHLIQLGQRIHIDVSVVIAAEQARQLRRVVYYPGHFHAAFSACRRLHSNSVALHNSQLSQR